tara:strand:+ start:451 stop:1293 length:843 start_codon:yes stop_codon:yes gene_type:complete
VIVLDGLEEVFDTYETFIIDLWGVVHDGVDLFPGVLKTLKKLKDLKRTVLLLSNSPRRKEPLMKQLKGLGLPSSLYTDLYSSGEDAYQTLRKQGRGKVCFPVPSSGFSDLLKDSGAQVTDDLEKADCLFNTGLGSLHLSRFETLLQKSYQLKLPMICVNPDISVVSGGKVIFCAGALAERYEQLGGIVSYHGKPYKDIYQHLWKTYNCFDKERALALGDALTTDILGANRFGVSSVLVLSGLEGRALGLSPGGFVDKERLYRHCQNKGVMPTYLLHEMVW